MKNAVKSRLQCAHLPGAQGNKGALTPSFISAISRRPVSPKRQIELQKVFEKCKAGKIYVTAFMDFATYKKYANDIAWETEVWIAEMPSHMIHFNGNKFLGPR